MLNIGELYHYDNQLETATEVGNVSIFCIDHNLIKSDHLSELDLLVKLKDTFIETYAHELAISSLSRAHLMWNEITSVLINKSADFNSELLSSNDPFAELAQDLKHWLENGQQSQELGAILKNFEVVASGNLELFSIYYGLKVLNFISNKFNLESDSGSKVVDTFFEENNLNGLTKIHEMIAICPSTLAPLFQASEIEVIHYDSNFDRMIGAIVARLEKNENISLVLTLGVDEDILVRIKKYFDNRLLICTIPESVSSVNKTNFFAELGLKTIGMSESSIKNELGNS